MKPLPKLLFCSLLFSFSTKADEPSHSCKFDIRHLEYQGIGFNQGYTTLDLFLANRNAEPLLYFLNAKAHIFNDGKPACNVGGGWRYPFDPCHAIGFNAYYDYRKTKRYQYHQAGLGVEYLAPRWQIVANGYLPFGRKKSEHYDLAFAGFSGNNFFVSREFEFSLFGADLEAGWHFKQWEWVDLFAGAGPYFFQGQIGKTAVGGKARIEARISPYFKLEVGDSYDNVFRNRFHAEASVSIPFGPRSRLKQDSCCSSSDQIMLQQWLHDIPERQEIIVLDQRKKKSLGLDPATGLPYFLIFVNNTSSSNGTYESPYASLAAAETASQASDVIYVFPGDGTTANMNAGITLKASQRFLGSGVSHGFNTTVGHITIPAQTTLWPSITNGATVVALDINNEVSGFNILAGTTGVASGSWLGKTLRADINRNRFLNTAGDSISLLATSCIPTLSITENSFFLPAGNAINTPFDNAFGSVRVENNEIFGGINGIAMTHANLAQVVVTISGNTISNPSNSCIYVDAQGAFGIASTVDTSIADNELTSLVAPAGASIYLLTNNDSVHTSSVVNNQIENAFMSVGIQVEDGNTTSLSSTRTTVKQNQINGANMGIYLLGGGAGSGNINATIEENTIAYTSNGIQVDMSGLQIASGSIHSNQLGTPAGLLFIGISLNLGSTSGNFTVSSNRISNASIPISANCFSNDQFINISSNIAMNNSGSPISIQANGATTRAVVRNNQFSNNGAVTDFSATANAGSLCLQLQDNVSELGYSLINFAIFDLEYPASNLGGLHFSPSISAFNLVPPGTCD